MKFKLLLIACLLSTSLLHAQEVKKKRNEVTFLFKNFDTIGIGYRFGSSSALWRISLDGGAKQTEHIDLGVTRYTTTQSSISLDLGREYRFEVIDKLFVRIGGDAFYSRYNLKSKTGSSYTFQQISREVKNEFGIKVVSGLIYQPTDRIHLGFEILPTFSRGVSEKSYASAIETTPTNFTTITEKDHAFNLNSSSLRFNVGFNF